MTEPDAGALAPLDWAVIGAYALASVGFALWFARRKQHTGGEYYMVAGRRLPWWMVGVADVATADGADALWVFAFFQGAFMAYFRMFWLAALVGVPLSIVWARYWRRLHLNTPGQLYELRYGGAASGRFRAFVAGYGALVNTGIVLAYVLKGFSEIMVPFLGWDEDTVLTVFCGTTLLYTMLSGLLAVAVSDVVQLVLMMIGRIVFAWILLDWAGGLSHVLDRVATVRGADFLTGFPPADGPAWGDFKIDGWSMVALLISGVFGVAGTQSPSVQKSLAAKDERHAAGGMIFGAVLSLVVRLLPMSVIGLVAVAVFPADRTDTGIWAELARAHAGPGVLGLLLVGIVAGYMSTIDGYVNFAAAGVLNDIYLRHMRPNATDRQQVMAGRVATVVVMGMAWLWARVLIANIDAAWINFINSVTFLFMLPLTVLRWGWWRLNIWGELVGFVLSFPLAYSVWFGLPGLLPAFQDRPYWQAFLLLFCLGWVAILAVTAFTQPAPREVLAAFYRRARPPGFWGPVAGWAETQPSDAALRRSERRMDLALVAAGTVFTTSLVGTMGAGFGRQWGVFAALVGLLVASAVAFAVVNVRGDRLRRQIAGSPQG